MSALQKRAQPESPGNPQKKPELPHRPEPKPEITGKGKPGAMPENPANVDHEHEPAGIDRKVDRTKAR